MLRLAIAACGVLAGASLAGAQQSDVLVTRSGRPEIELDPGRAATVVFRVANAVATTREIETAIRIPAGWHAFYGGSRLALAPSESRLELISVSTPRTTAPGTYTVYFDVRVAGTPGAVTDSALVLVRELHALTVVSRTAPSVALTGDTVRMTFLVTNGGNTPSDVRIRMRAPAGFSARSSWVAGALSAGESRGMDVTLRVPRSAVQTSTEFVTVWAEGADSTVSSEVMVPLEIIPLGISAELERPEVPGTFIIRSGTGRAPSFGSYESRGALSKDGYSRLDVTLLSAEKHSPLYRERDQYRAELRVGESAVQLGDRVWTLSPLTEAGHYGLGAGGQLVTGPLLVGGFYDNGPRDVPGRKQVGAFGGLRFGRGFRASSLTLQYLAWSDTAPGSIWSLRGQLPLFPGTHADAEYARGTSDSSRVRQSARIALDGGYSWISYSVQHTQSDSAFPVRGRPALSDDGSLSLRLIPHVWVDGTLNAERTAFDALLGAGIPNQRRFTNLGLSIDRFVRIEGRQEGFVTPGQPWADGWRMEAVRGSLTIPIGIMTLSPQFQAGRSAQPNDTTMTPFTLSTLELSLQLGAGQQLSLRVDQTHGAAGNPDLRYTMVSLHAGVELPTHTRLDVSATNFGAGSGPSPAPWYAGSRRWDVSVAQRVWLGHRIIARYGTFLSPSLPGAPPPVTAFRVDYAIPLGIPIGRAPDGGRIVAELSDGETGSPMPGLLLRVGTHTVMTDRAGRARFSDLAEGDHWLTIDPSSVGAVRLTMPALPLKVAVRIRDESTVRIRLTRSARMHGIVHRFERSTVGSDTALVVSGGIAGVTIEATREGGRYFAVTDANGEFEIPRLEPGMWHVQVESMESLPFYQLARPVIEVELKPGEDAAVTFQVVPKQKNIRFDQGGEIRDQPAKRGNSRAELPPGKRMKDR
jgi:hypothetical protein